MLWLSKSELIGGIGKVIRKGVVDGIIDPIRQGLMDGIFLASMILSDENPLVFSYENPSTTPI